MNRRQFVSDSIVLASTSSASSAVTSASLPWYGFNLQEKFTHSPEEWARVAPEWGRSNEPFRESDFALIAELGFNFVRLPLSYRCWVSEPRDKKFIESRLREIDQAIKWGREYDIHVCLNFHRAPGYCINDTTAREPFNLWKDAEALDYCRLHWTMFANRYKGIDSRYLSFNLLNEPSRCSLEEYVRVGKAISNAVRSVDAKRLIVVDGLFGEAMLPATQLNEVGNVVQSTRGYAPFLLTHFEAPWGEKQTRSPAWPVLIGNQVVWDRSQLKRWCIDPFLPAERGANGILVGEWGAWNHTPHDIVLAWMRDLLSLWRDAKWGWALWCFRGSFGILDSGRRDLKYERWRGHLLDREMLEILKEFRSD